MRELVDNERRLDIAKQLFGWEPHPTQRLWLLDDHRVKVAACGRRWGKTEAEAIDAATFAFCNPGSVQMIVSPSYDQSKLIFGTVEKLLLNSDSTVNKVKSVKTPYPRLEINGSVIMARTADENGRNLRGHFADKIIADEAAYISDEAIEEVISPMLADRDGQLILISTPCGKNHFWRAYALGAGPGKPVPFSEAGEGEDAKSSPSRILDRYKSFHFPSWDNPHISREYIEHQRKVLTERQFSVEYEAEFLDDQAAVFPWADIQSAIEIPFSAPECEYRTAGIDWARYSDFTVIAVIETGSEPHRVVAIDRFNRISWDKQIERTVDFLVEHRVNAVLTDQTSIGDPLLDQLKAALWKRTANVNVEGLAFTNTSKRELIDNLVIKLAHRELSIPNDEQLLRELRFFEYELTESGNIRMNARRGSTDDCVIAISLAAWKAKNTAWSRTFLASEGRLVR